MYFMGVSLNVDLRTDLFCGKIGLVKNGQTGDN